MKKLTRWLFQDHVEIETEESIWKLKLFISLTVIIGFIQITLFFYNLILNEFLGMSLFLVLVLGIFFLITSLWARNTRNTKYPLIVIVIWLSIHMTIRASTTGGTAAPVTYWIPIVPVLILVTFGAKEGWFAFFLMTISMTITSFMVQSQLAPFELRRIIMVFSLILVVSVMAYIDNRRRNIFAKLLQSTNSIRVSKSQQMRTSQSEVFLNLSKQIRDQMQAPLNAALEITEKSILAKDFSDEEKLRLMKLQKALMRISSIHETMHQMENTSLSFVDYTDRSEMLDLSTKDKK